MAQKPSRRPLIITLALLLYAAVVALLNRDVLLVEHDYLRYFGTLGVEAVIICLVYIFLSKREKPRRANK